MPLQAYAVLIIDEAQNLSLAAARGDPHPRPISKDPKSCCSSCSSASPSFATSSRIRRCGRSISASPSAARSQPLERDAVPGYIAHRLIGRRRRRRSTVEFVPDAIDLLFTLVERVIPASSICIADKSLHRGASRADLDHHAGHRRPQRSASSAMRRPRADACACAAEHAGDCRACRFRTPSFRAEPMRAPVLVMAPLDTPALADCTEEDPHDLTKRQQEDGAVHACVRDSRCSSVHRRKPVGCAIAAILVLAGLWRCAHGGPCRKGVGAAA